MALILKRKMRWVLAAAAGLCGLMPGQTSTSAALSKYLQPGALPGLAREFLQAMGNRVQKPGLERVVLAGSYTDSTKSAIAATLTWEAPGNLRLTRRD